MSKPTYEDLERRIMELEQKERERAEMEKLLREREENLEKIIKVRTSELTGMNSVLREEIAERKKAEKELWNMMQLQEFIVSLSTQFINIDLDSIDDSITQVLGKINRRMELDRSYIVKFGDGGRESLTGYAGNSEGNRWLPDVSDPSFQKSVFRWMDALKTKENIQIVGLEEFSKDAKDDREYIESQGIKSLLILPLKQGWEPAGVIGFETIHAKREWKDEDLGFFQLVAEIFMNALERKRVEKELRESEKRFLLAHRAANIGNWDWDIRSGRLYWSDIIEPMFGFKRGEFEHTYNAFLDCVHPDDRHYVEESVAAAIDREIEYNIEYRIRWRDGSVRWVSVIGEIIRDQYGKAVRMIGIIQDTTDRKRMEIAFQKAQDLLQQRFEERNRELSEMKKELVGLAIEKRQAEAALRESRFRYALAERIGHVGHWVFNFEENEAIWSEGTFRILGIEEESIQPTFDRYLRSVHASDSEWLQEAIKKLLSSGEPLNIEYRIVRPDNSERIVYSECEVRFDERRKAVAIVGTIHDITDRQKAFEEINRLKSAIDQAFEAIVITDLQGSIQYVNPAFEKMTGYSHAEVIGREPDFLNKGEDAIQIYNEMWKTILQGEMWHGELLNTTKTGREFYGEITITPVKNEKNEIINFIAVQRDVTERRELENKLDKLRHEYEAFMRHEVKNLATPIRGYAEMLWRYAGDILGSREKAYLERIESITDRLISIIDRLQKLQNFEIGNYTLEKADCDLKGIIADTISDLKNLADENEVTIACHYGDEVASKVEIDRSLFPGVIHNLLKNSIEHISKLEVKADKVVRINLANEADRAVLAINNKGKPVSPERLKLFFEKFNSDRMTKSEGMGLGTTYAYLVTKAHGGDIVVHSNEYDGTTVTVRLPLAAR